MKLSPPQRATTFLDAELGIENPLPDQSGDDEGESEGVEQDRSERILETDLLVEQRSQDKSDDQRKHEGADAVDQEVLDRDQPTVGRPQSFILVETDEPGTGQELGPGERIEDGPQRTPDEDHQRGQTMGMAATLAFRFRNNLSGGAPADMFSIPSGLFLLRHASRQGAGGRTFVGTAVSQRWRRCQRNVLERLPA